KTQNLVFGKLDKVSIVGIAIFTLTILVIIANFATGGIVPKDKVDALSCNTEISCNIDNYDLKF
ncbi:MAG: hypothetical protein RSC99_10380, partial [Clostridiales bacterium]